MFLDPKVHRIEYESLDRFGNGKSLIKNIEILII
jgi:hypothetical protein